MQIETTMWYHLIPVRMAIITKSTELIVGLGVKKRESSYTVSGNVNRFSHNGKQYGGFLKK